MRTIRGARDLIRLHELNRWAIPLLIVLGLVASALEGLGVYLFIPLLQILMEAPMGSGTGARVVDLLVAFSASLPPDHRIIIITACIVASIALKNAIQYLNLGAFAYLNSRTSHDLRSRVFDRIVHLDYCQLDQSRYGGFVNTLGNSTWRATDALGVLARMIVNACACVMFVLLLFLLSWQLTLLTLFFVGLISLIALRITASVKALGQHAVEANGNLAERMWEAFAGFRVIRAFGREAYERSRYDAASRAVRDTFFKLEMVSAVTHPVSEVLAVALIAGLVLAFGDDKTMLATLIAFLVLLHRLLPKARELTAAQVSFNALASAVDDVRTLLKRPDERELLPGTRPFHGLTREIVVDRVTFSYGRDEERALEDISFRIPQGTTTAIVGPSGAGKSTLISLLCRFYDVERGEIRVDGTPLREIRLADWRSQIAIISQDVHMFDATVQENIAYGRLDADEADIIAAARLAHAHDFIMELADGYATPVGNRGVRLSGGQRQRIALARAIIRNPGILILDEATNAVDSVAEQLIQDALDQFSHNRTIIIIAHRLATIARADQILVLDRGRLVEEGNLDSLLRADRLFARLYRLQYGVALEA